MLMSIVIFFEDILSHTDEIYFQNATNVLSITIKFWIHIVNESSGENNVIIVANISYLSLMIKLNILKCGKDKNYW